MRIRYAAATAAIALMAGFAAPAYAVATEGGGFACGPDSTVKISVTVQDGTRSSYIIYKESSGTIVNKSWASGSRHVWETYKRSIVSWKIGGASPVTGGGPSC